MQTSGIDSAPAACRRSGAWPARVFPVVFPLAAALAMTGCDRAAAVAEPSVEEPPPPSAVAALGRLEPQHGIIRVSASSVPEAISGAVLTELHVETGDDVAAGELIAVTDAAPVLAARLRETETELTLATREAASAASSADAACVRAGVAEREARRLTRLREQNLAAEDETDRARGDAEAGAADCTAARSAAEVARSAVAVVQARLERHRAELERSRIRAPVAGRVLSINSRPGELIGAEGILELGRVDRMYAIAEVYEADVARLRAGQRATVSSPALARPIGGSVERIRPLVRKQDEIGTDPAARKDARIVEVEVLLDDSTAASMLTHLQVEVVFEP